MDGEEGIQTINPHWRRMKTGKGFGKEVMEASEERERLAFPLPAPPIYWLVGWMVMLGAYMHRNHPSDVQVGCEAGTGHAHTHKSKTLSSGTTADQTPPLSQSHWAKEKLYRDI